MPAQMDEQQFKESVVAKFREHFDHFYRLHQFAEAALQEYRGFTKDHYFAALQAICPRAFKSFDAIRRLCEVASCEDAAVVLRCLLNLMAVTRWISRDPQRRAKKYLAWYWIELHRQAEQFPGRIPPAWVVDIRKNFDAVKSQFEYGDAKGKIKLVKHWYRPDVHTIFDLFKEVDLELHYEEAYRPLSGTEHSDVMTYFAMFANAEKRDGETKLEIQSDSFVRSYLRNGFQYFADIFGICNKTMALADDKQFQEIVAAGITFYQADLEARGFQSL